MIVKESLKLNRFTYTDIPDNCAFFSRFEGVRPTSTAFSGEDASPEIQSKIDAIVSGEKLVSQDMPE